jgi:hypothetical protein
VKCESYIPQSEDNQYGPFQVQVKSISYQTDYEIRRLIIEVRGKKYYLKYFYIKSIFSLKMKNVKLNIIGIQVKY